MIVFSCLPPLLAVLACAEVSYGPPPPTLQFGVDMAQEADAVCASFERAGYPLSVSQSGKHFTALAFESASGEARAVRVVTARGIALSLDSRQASAIGPEVRYVLLPRSVFSANGQARYGALEVVYVEERWPGQDRRCVRMYVVSQGGLVTQSGGTEEDGALCLATSDGDGDGRLELVTEVTVDGLSLPAVPSLPVLLVPSESGELTRKASEAALATHYGPLVVQRRAALAVAQQAGRALEVYRLATELAFAAFLQGQGPEAQRVLLSQAFAALPQEHRDAALESAIMARASEGW